MAALLTAPFSGSLGNEHLETPQHGGLKRVDIPYDKIAADGFLRWISLHFPSAIVVVECKNVGKELCSPDLDQIAMRFSPDRGSFGILVARSISDRGRMDARCRSAAADGHGHVIALDDNDLRQIVADVQEALDKNENPREFPLLREQFGRLIGQH